MSEAVKMQEFIIDFLGGFTGCEKAIALIKTIEYKDTRTVYGWVKNEDTPEFEYEPGYLHGPEDPGEDPRFKATYTPVYK